MRLVGYTYEASVHCPPCARKAFPEGPDIVGLHDSEGNPVHAIFDIDEHDPNEACDDCGELLE